MSQPQARPAKPESTRSKVIAYVFLALVVVGGFAGLWALNHSDAEVAGAKPGQCMHKSSSTEVEVVDCTDKQADFTVVGRKENVTEISAEIGACSSFDDVDSSVFVTKRNRWGITDDKGVVLCLAKKK
jgi:hypothetical protein